MRSLRIPRLAFFCLLLTLATSTAVVSQESGVVPRYDGTEVTYYVDLPETGSYPMVVILQGSECLKVSHKYGDLRKKILDKGTAVLRVEKPGLTAQTEIGDCPLDYRRLNTPQQRVMDLLAVLGHLKERHPDWNGDVALMGGSEGSIVATMTATRYPNVKAVALLSGGGGATFAAEMLQAWTTQMKVQGKEQSDIDEMMKIMAEGMKEAIENPTPYEEFASDEEQLAFNTHYWWSKILPYKGLNVLRQLKSPLLIVHSKQDLHIPFESAESLYKTLKAEGSDVKFLIYEGQHVPDVDTLSKAIDWMHESL